MQFSVMNWILYFFEHLKPYWSILLTSFCHVHTIHTSFTHIFQSDQFADTFTCNVLDWLVRFIYTKSSSPQWNIITETLHGQLILFGIYKRQLGVVCLSEALSATALEKEEKLSQWAKQNRRALDRNCCFRPLGHAGKLEKGLPRKLGETRRVNCRNRGR